MIKIPVGMKFYTNVSIVRLKFGKTRLEVACYKNKIQDWRDKKEINIDEVLQVNTIFKNAAKGDVISEKEINTLFHDMTKEQVIKLILDKGEIQVGDKERTNATSNLRNDIANIIVEKTFNLETGLPFPIDIITQALDEIEFQIHEGHDAKKQALIAIKAIQNRQILHLERKLMQIKLTIKNKDKLLSETAYSEFIEKLLNFLKTTESQIIEENASNIDAFSIKCNIRPNYYRQFLTNYDNVLSFEIISSSLTLKAPNKPEEEKVKENKEEGKMKISNANVDKFLDDNFGDEEEAKSKKSKKKIHCTKCKDSAFETQEELRTHSKTNWHKFNACLSAKGKESYSAEEYDDYVLMNPGELK